MFGEKYIIFYFYTLLLNVYRMLCIWNTMKNNYWGC